MRLRSKTKITEGDKEFGQSFENLVFPELTVVGTECD